MIGSYVFDDISKIINKDTKAFYVFDIDILRDRIDFIRNSMPKNISLCYAVKANTFVSKYIKDMVERFEICSPGEEKICKKQGIESSKMVISGIYKDPFFIKELIEDKSFDGIFTIESMEQFSLIKKLADREVKVLLRLTNDSQFGIDIADIEKIISEIDNYKFIKVLGIQYFTGTQKTSIKKFKREFNDLEKLLENLKEKYSYTPEEIEYGTGFAVKYFEDESIDEENLFKEFSNIIEEFSFKGKITLEIGRSIVASCGTYYAHIVDIKTNREQNYIILDGGMHQIVYFGQRMAMRKPFVEVIRNKNLESEDETLFYNVCGSLCTMNDILVKQLNLKKVHVGDVLKFSNAGAYSMTEGMSLFLSRDLPAIYIKTENSFKCLRENFETYILNMEK